FTHYKDLETGKWVRIDGWGNSAEARAEILQSIENYKTA
ncbi:MAG TPA: inorganic diphosphatase, partial [Pseudomonadales bacterium]|nr:inorganic diphosphatase [Pseudomonadales bacterium]